MDFSCPTCGSNYKQDLRQVTMDGITQFCWDGWHNQRPEPPFDLDYMPIHVTVRTDDGRKWASNPNPKSSPHLEEVRN